MSQPPRPTPPEHDATASERITYAIADLQWHTHRAVVAWRYAIFATGVNLGAAILNLWLVFH